jgi:hypothetical protein
MKDVENMPVNGEPTVFETGAKRDNQAGKGRIDLMPLYVVSECIEHDLTHGADSTQLEDLLRYIESFQRDGSDQMIIYTIVAFGNKAYKDLYTAFIEAGHRYEAGGVKYGDRNWEQGVPLHVYVNSAIRHLLKWYRGDDDEDHAGAVIWNLLNLVWTYRTYPDMNDLPNAKWDELDFDYDDEDL